MAINSNITRIVIPIFYVTFLISIAGIVFSQTTFAEGFIPFPQVLLHSPTICAFEPIQDPQFPGISKTLLDMTDYSITDWRTKLNEGAGKYPPWEITLIKVPLSEQENFDNSKCDISIHFLRKPDNPNLEYVVAGIAMPNFEQGKSRIEIYYAGIEVEAKKTEWREGDTIYYTYVYNPRYTGFLAPNAQLSGTIRHEIGHAFGLGHYVVSYEKRDKIVNGEFAMPSIMIDTVTVIGVTHYDITPFDVSKIKSIYGYYGFDSKNPRKTGFERTHLISLSKTEYGPDEKITISIKSDNLEEQEYLYAMTLDPNNKIIEYFTITKSNSTFSVDMSKYQKTGKYSLEFVDYNKNIYDFASFIITDGQSQDILKKQTGNKIKDETTKTFETKKSTTKMNSKCEGKTLCIVGKVEKIIDGDTMYLKNYKIRLSLTNTPEKNEKGFKEATAFTTKLCPIGSSITIDQDDKQPYDKYKRIVGKVTCSGKVLNSELLYSGHANIITQYCSKSEFSSESWAKKYGC